VFGKSVHDSMDNAIRGQFTSDWIVTSKNGWSAFPTAAGSALEKAPGVTQSTDIRGDQGLIGKNQVSVNGIDPKTIGGLYEFQWARGTTDGALAELNSNGAIVKEAVARDKQLQLGAGFVLLSPSGDPVSLRVAGFYQTPRIYEVLGGVIIGQHTFDATFSRP